MSCYDEKYYISKLVLVCEEPMVELTDCPSLLVFVLLAPMISVMESGCFLFLDTEIYIRYYF